MIDLNEYVKAIEPVDEAFGRKAQAREDILTKPQGSLGLLEELAVQIASIKREAIPHVNRKVVFTFAGDHGVVQEGVSAFPSEVTPQMVLNFAGNGAAINVLARQAGAELIIADLGVAAELELDHPNFRSRKVGPGTKNFTKEPAMSLHEAEEAIINGIEIFEEEHAKTSIDLAGTGEMGIGNTTPATAILAVISGENIENIVGRGTGIDDDGITRKINAISKAIRLHQPDKNDGMDMLQKIGGFEIGGLVGVILAAAKNHVPVLIDGFISTSAALIAYKLNRLTAQYMLASHQSEERGHKKMWDILGKKPILDLGLRLGEGTGGALAMNIVEAATRILSEMATFESAGVSDKDA
ncbi:MAG: nicotinate-nucleotide--dimethylbenzimidazole phosphoribosyltransferase [bacterium]|nr:nicotinate-nucleotide--dimethylbenzimidazole phosphoribosyltransferase [bacterium]